MTNARKLFGVRTASGCGATRRDARKWGLALFVAALVALLMFGWGASAAQAQKTPGVTQVTVTGTITLITTDAPLSPTDIFEGGTITVGTQQVIIPRNLLLELPANRLTLWQFARLSHVSGFPAEGHAIATIMANRLPDGRVIAGWVNVLKGTSPVGDSLTGRVTFINNAQGYFRIEGAPGADTGGVMVRLNDPTAVHSIQSGLGCSPLGGTNCSPDDRFILDPLNYTNVFATGYPLCIPTAVSAANCPASNRNQAATVETVANSTRFAPIMVGDHLRVTGNYEVVNGVTFFSAWNTMVSAKLLTKITPTQPDYVVFYQAAWDDPAFPANRLRIQSFFGAGTEPATAPGAAPRLDVFSLHTDQNNVAHELPLGSSVNNPNVAIDFPPGSQLWRIKYDLDFGGAALPTLDPCITLTAAGFPVCPAGGNIEEKFRIVSPPSREIIAHTRHQAELLPGVVALDISGHVAQSGQYLTPVEPHFPVPEEDLDLTAQAFPYLFEGIPWDLDRRVGPQGCNGPCELSALPLNPFPFSGWDPRIVPSPKTGAPPVPAAVRDKMLSFFPFGPPNGNGSAGLLQLPPQSGNVPTAPPFGPQNEVIIFTIPTVTIISHPPTPTNIKTPTFAFTTSTGTTFRCSLSLTAVPAFVPCTSPFTFPPQLDGTFTFTVVAFDAGLNPSLPATFTFTIDTVPPVVTLTATPPVLTPLNTPSFSFISSKTPVTFQCSLSTGADAFAPCTSPITFPAQPNGLYTFKVIATDLAGNVSAPAIFTFTIATRPFVILQTPTPNSIGIPLNTTVSATFSPSRPLNPATVTTASFSLRAAGAVADVPATVTVNATGTIITLTPTALLAPGTVYTATIAGTVADTTGVTVAAPVIWSFTTDTAPTVTAQAPPNGATGVPVTTTVSATFSKPMNAASITTATFTLRAAGAAADVPATVIVNAAGTVATLTPTTPLVAGTVYTATVAATAADTIGTPLGIASVWSFTTNPAPAVIAESPAPGAINVPLNTTVSATFSKPMNAATITTATFTLRAAGAAADVPATVIVNAAGTIATLTPTSPLLAGTVYTATVAATVTDTIATPLGTAFVWSFTTDVAPTVIAQAPPNGATGVPLNTTVSATFSKPMNAASITTATFTLRAAGAAAPVPATVTVNAAGTIAALTPTSPLLAGTVYTATVAATVTDVAGTPFGTASTWSFTTDVAPTVIAQAPPNGAINVPLTTTVTATFSTAMNAATITTASFTLTAAGAAAPVPATVTVNAAGTVATLTPTTPLAAGTVYTATVAATVTNTIGTPFGTASTWSFTTDVAPRVIAQAPPNGATGVPLTSTVTATFSKPVNAATITTASFTLRAVGAAANVPATVTLDATGTIATLTPTTPLAVSTAYTATVSGTVTDVIGTPMGTNVVWSFTTDVPPTVIAQAPPNGATGVPLNTTVSATFSKPMTAASITTATFSLRAAGAAVNVPATVTLNAAGTIATLTPTSPLALGTVYTATVSGTVTDVAGTVLGADSVWSFTTDVAPTVIAQAPTPNATGVAIATTVTATFSKPMAAATITTASFTLRAAGAAANVPATVTLDATGTIATLTPTSPLAVGTVYTATVSGSVTDVVGTALGTNVAWSFTTVQLTRMQQVSGATFFATSLPINLGKTTTGNTLLVAIETNSDIAVSSITDTQGNTYVKDAGFAGAPNRLSIWRASNITGGAAPVVTINFVAKETATAVVAEYNGIASVSPFDQTASNNQFGATSYSSGTTPATTLATELVFGVHMNRSTNVGTWTPAGGFGTVLEADNATSKHQLQVQDQFVTTTGAFASTGAHSTAVTITSLIATYRVGAGAAPPPPPPPPPATPTVTAQSPTPNATGVATTTTVTATFSTAMNAASITTASFSLRAAGAAANVPATVTLNATGTIATLTPTTPLAAGTVFTATVAATVTSSAGTPMGANVVWSFTTAPAAPVNAPPTVTAQSPTPNATGVATNTNVTATFSTAMNAATITTASFSLRAAGAAADVPATVTLDATGTIATLTPTTPLAAGTVFTATVAGTVTSAAGTPMGANVVWSFTTAPAAPVAGAIARVQAVSGETVFASTLPITLGTTTTGNTLLVAIETNSDIPVSSVTDTQGNTYVMDAGFVAAPNRLNVWRASNIIGGAAPVVTITFVAKEEATAVVAEYSGLLNVAPFDQTASNNQFNATSYTSGNTPPTTQATELVFGVHVNRTGLGTWTPAAGFTTVQERDNVTSKHQLQVQDRIVTATGAQASTGTHSTPVTITSLVVTYK